MLIRYFLALLLCIISFFGVAQSETISERAELLKKSPASPTSSSIAKYLEFPVSMATGLPSIQIPIYTVQNGNISVPITLSYHCGGVKVDEFAGKVGMNWTLSVGGSISRRINGLDDFFEGSNSVPLYGTYYNPNISGYYPYNTVRDIINGFGTVQADSLELVLGRIAQGKIDGEADEYLYTTPSGNGKAFYDQENQKFLNNQANGWSVEYVANDSAWHITTNAGIKYIFQHKEYIRNPILFRSDLLNGECCVINTYLPNAWHLTTIQDNKTGKWISFDYHKEWKYRHTGFDQTWFFDVTYGTGRGWSNNYLERQGDEMFAKYIATDNETVEFIEDSIPRKDDGSKVIKEVRVKDITGAIVKRVLFKYFYDTSRFANNQLDTASMITFLESVQEIYIDGSDTIVNAPYKFNYDLQKHMPRRLSFAQDQWGYYNGKLSNTTLVPNDVLQMYQVSNGTTAADRSIDTAYSKVGIIKEVVYPTGGKAVFTFENNIANWELSGGLRIKKVAYYDPASDKNLSTEYSYLDNNNLESGVRIFSPLNHWQYREVNGPGETSVLKVYGTSVAPLFSYQGSPVMYGCVERRQIGTSGNIKTRHYFTLPQAIDGGTGGPSGGVPMPKTVIDEGGGLEWLTQSFKYNPGTSSYDLIKVDSIIYSPLNNYEKSVKNIQCAWIRVLSSEFINHINNDPYLQFPLNMQVGTNIYRHYQESVLPKEKYSRQIESAGQILSRAFIEYDTATGNERSIKTINSKGDTLITIKRYKSDFGIYPSSTNLWNYAISNLFPALPIEVLSYKKPSGGNALLIDAQLFFYEENNIKEVYKLEITQPSSTFVPSYNDANNFYFDSRYKLQQKVNQFTNYYNPSTVETNQEKASYIYGNNFNVITAHITNADISDVAFSSFEFNEKGSWVYTGTITNNSSAPTGKKCYQLSTGNIQRTGLTSGRTYIVSYWSNSGTYTVSSSISTKQGRTVNGWTNYEHEITGSTSVTISGSGYIDEVRLFPQGSLMTTFTYQPLVGITSQSDANNKTIYYEYDTFLRLKAIKDQENNILKTFEYKYQQNQ